MAVTYDVNADGSGLSVTLRVLSRRLSLCIVCPHLFHLRHILVGFELETECLLWWYDDACAMVTIIPCTKDVTVITAAQYRRQ